MSTPFSGNVTRETNLSDKGSLTTANLYDPATGTGHGQIAYSDTLVTRGELDLELNASLLSLPGQMITGDSHGCKLFCSLFSFNNKSINFEDFIKSFLPIKLEKAKQLL
jgi:hypothetical protein